MYPFGGLAVLRGDAKLELYVDASEDENFPLELDFTRRLADQLSIACRDLARLQRASEGPGQSTGSRRDDVVDRRRVRVVRSGGPAIVFGDGAVHAERDRFLLAGYVRHPQRAFHSLDPCL